MGDSKTTTTTATTSVCQDCLMMVRDGEYHPYPACAMYRQTRSGEKVRGYLKQIIEYGANGGKLERI
jgi:hypothetical protein